MFDSSPACRNCTAVREECVGLRHGCGTVAGWRSLKPAIRGLLVVMAGVALIKFEGTPLTPASPLPREPAPPKSKIGEFQTNEGFLPCKTPPQDCRTWTGSPRPHWGIDVGTPFGSSLFVVAGSPSSKIRVTCGQDPGGYGKFAKIQPLGEEESSTDSFLAAHLSRCVAGIYEAGAEFGKSGNSGFSTGPHLHFEHHRDEKPIPPERWATEAILGVSP